MYGMFTGEAGVTDTLVYLVTAGCGLRRVVIIVELLTVAGSTGP